ncbi:hypothetical protein EJB05_45408, partial [Eragrostis curvula]
MSSLTAASSSREPPRVSRPTAASSGPHLATASSAASSRRRRLSCSELEFIHPFCRLYYTSLPASAFWFSATLRVASINSCHLPDDVVETLHFPQLKQLGLGFIEISNGALNRLIAGCPVLEYLLLNSGYFEGIRIKSPSIISIGISSGKLIIEDAPSLVSVKMLAISTSDLNVHMVINLLICFPCVEKLYIESAVSKDRNFWRRKHRDLIKCLDMRLKTIVLKNYRGTKSQLSFASFFVLNAKLLELMVFEGEVYKDDQISIAEQHRLLQLEKRASIGARFSFTAGRRCRHNILPHIKHVSDLSITNPFECTC